MEKQQFTVCLTVAILSMVSSQGFCTLNLNDGGTYDIWWTINDDIHLDTGTPDMQTTLNILTGAVIIGDVLAFNDSRLNITGGTINDHVQIYDNAQITMTDGEITGSFNIYTTNLIEISGGSVGGHLAIITDGQATISNVTVNNYFACGSDSQVTISGGSLTNSYWDIRENSHSSMYGGTMGVNADIRVYNTAILEIYGSDFTIDGTSVPYGDVYSLLKNDISYEPIRRIIGTLASGETIDTRFRIGHTAKIVLIYEPVGEPEPICLMYPAMDFNTDCKVDLIDFAEFISQWLDCNLEPESACWE